MIGASGRPTSLGDLRITSLQAGGQAGAPPIVSIPLTIGTGGGGESVYLPTGALALGGLAKVVPDWAGASVRVRNAAGTEQDIGFVGQTLDAGNAFLASGGPFTLPIVYDQTGNGHHFTQPTVANQPTLWLGEDGPTITDYTGALPLLIPSSLAIDKADVSIFMVTRSPGNGATDGYFAWGTAAVDYGLTSPRAGSQLQLQPMVAGVSLNSTVANAQAMPINNDSIIGLVSSATKQVVHRDEQTAEYAATASAVQNSGGQVGEAIVYDGRNDWRMFAVYPALSDVNVAAVKTALKAIFNTAEVAAEYWLFEGDSIIFGVGGTHNRTISAAVEYRSPKSTLFRNRGVSGTRLADNYTKYDTLSAGWITPGVNNIVVEQYGHNDIKIDVDDAATALTVVAAMKTQFQSKCAKMRTYWAALSTPVIIIAQEVLADTSGSWTVDMESARDAWNAWLRTFPLADDGLPCFDALDTVASDNSFILSDFETDAGRGMTDGQRSADGVHPDEDTADERAIKIMATKAAIPMTLRYVPVVTGTQGQAYTGYTPQVVLGTAPITYSIQAGTLPTGLTLNTSTGVISGTPTVVETRTGIVVRATDALAHTDDSDAFQIAVSASQQVVVESRTRSFSATDTTTASILLPATVNAGDMLLIPIAVDGLTVVTWDNVTAGTWTSLFVDGQSPNRLQIFYKIADGTEDGLTLTATLASSQQFEAMCYRLSGVQGGINVSAATAKSASSFSPDPIIATASWGSANNWFLAVAGLDNAVSISSGPSGYTNLLTNISSGSGNAGLSTAYASIVAASDNPGVFTSTTSIPYICATVVVRPS